MYLPLNISKKTNYISVDGDVDGDGGGRCENPDLRGETSQTVGMRKRYGNTEHNQ